MHGRNGIWEENYTQRSEDCDHRIYVSGVRKVETISKVKRKKGSKKKRKRMEIEESEVSDNEQHHSDEKNQIESQDSEIYDCIIIQTK